MLKSLLGGDTGGINPQNTLYVSASGGNYNTIQGAIDSITDNTITKIIIDTGVFTETITIPADRNIAFSGAFKGTLIVGDITWNKNTATDNVITFENINMSTGTLSVTATNPANVTSLWIKSGTLFAARTVNFTGATNTGVHILHMVSITQSAATLNIDNAFFDLQASQIGGITTIDNSSIGQVLGGEIGNTVNVTNSSQFYPRVSATILQTVDFNVDATSFIELDGQTRSTANLNGAIGSFRILDGNTAGLISPSITITDNGDGTIDLPSAQVFLFDNSIQFGKPRRYDIVAQNNVALTDNQQNFIQINYNSGTPIWQVLTSKTANGSDIVCVQRRFREGNTQFIIPLVYTGEGLADKILQKEFDRGVEILNGLILSTQTGQYFKTSTGITYCGLSKQTYPAFDSSLNTFREYTPTGGTYAYTNENTLNNTQYVSGGNLVAMLPNRYNVNWIWASESDANLFFTTPHNADYATLSAAQQANINTTLNISGFPNIIKQFGVLVGGVIFQQGATTGTVLTRDQILNNKI